MISGVAIRPAVIKTLVQVEYHRPDWLSCLFPSVEMASLQWATKKINALFSKIRMMPRTVSSLIKDVGSPVLGTCTAQTVKSRMAGQMWLNTGISLTRWQQNPYNGNTEAIFLFSTKPDPWEPLAYAHKETQSCRLPIPQQLGSKTLVSCYHYHPWVSSS